MNSNSFARYPIPVDLRIAVLLALSDAAERCVLNERMRVPLAFTLASAWSAEKLKNSQTLLAEGQKPPPILVTRYWLHGTGWYVVGDGNHRTVAAQAADRKTIDAIVGSAVICSPASYRINARLGVLQRDGESNESNDPVVVAQELDREFIDILRQAGVPWE